jgi:hypothetical protein
MLAPQLLDELIDGHNTPPASQQESQNRALLRSSDRQRIPARRQDLKGPENKKTHPPDANAPDHGWIAPHIARACPPRSGGATLPATVARNLIDKTNAPQGARRLARAIRDLPELARTVRRRLTAEADVAQTTTSPAPPAHPCCEPNCARRSCRLSTPQQRSTARRRPGGGSLADGCGRRPGRAPRASSLAMTVPCRWGAEP